MNYGTDAALTMLERAKPGGWGNPCFGDDVAGAVMPGEGQMLYGLVRALRPERILEIGTGYGFSTIHLAAGCRDNGVGRVWTVENHHERRAAAITNVEAAGLRDLVDFSDHWPEEPAVFALAHLDAGHTAEDVTEYLARVTSLMDEAAPVLVHDAGYNDHVKIALEAADDDWQVVWLPGTSFMGYAILQRAGT